MKKFMLMAIALFTMSAVNAQIADQIKQSRDRAAKLEKLKKDFLEHGGIKEQM